MTQGTLFDSNGMINYDVYIVYFSGGKDCTASVLRLIEMGVPKQKIELWHHHIDGMGDNFMDWPITEAYCQAFADALGLKIYFSWKEGGFKREMLRKDSRTAPTTFITPDGELITVGGNGGKESTRRKFPQVSADLKVRWCSAYLKIDVGATAIRNQARFNGMKVCTISGERGEESTARSKYERLEADRSDNRNGKTPRFVDRWRVVLDWAENQVWDIIKRHKIRVHPCYYLGFSRCSCLFCIFGNANQFASADLINPKGSQVIQNFERDFGITIKRGMSIGELIKMGTPYKSITKKLAALAMSDAYDQQIIMPDSEEWLLPAGAFGESCGPV